MGDGQRTVQVEILGTKYVVRSEEDEAYIRELADYVAAKLEEFVSGRTGVPLQRLVILAALNIADELFRERARRRTDSADLQRRSERMLASLEAFEVELTA